MGRVRNGLMALGLIMAMSTCDTLSFRDAGTRYAEGLDQNIVLLGKP